MKTKLNVKNLRTIPFGTYRGVWGGYQVDFAVDTLEYEGTTDIGIRTISAPCLVTVDENGATVSLIDEKETS